MEVEKNRGRFVHIDKLLTRTSPLVNIGFEPGDAPQQALENCRVLCVGAGGLGCELLKDLALMGFTNIEVIDMDTIDVSNLNRQFLFRMHDVGKPKAEVAAAFVQKRIPTCNIKAHFKKIQDMDEDFYRSFNIIVLGLDSLEARRWMNAMVCELVELDDDGNVAGGVIPMVDGGTEGFKGHARVIIPGITANFEDTLDLFPPQTTFPLCTIATTPRSPAHCVVWAKEVQWDQVKPFGEGVHFDGDNIEHMQWVHEQAMAHAAKFGVEGVTLTKTQGIAKNIIPAIAATNAIVAAACAQECFKLATSCCRLLNNYMMYMGGQGIYTHTFEAERKETCPWFGQKQVTVTCKPTNTLQEVIDVMKNHPELQLKAPDVRADGKTLFMNVMKATHKNLTTAVVDLVPDQAVWSVTDAHVLRGTSRRVIVKFSSAEAQ